MKNNDMELAKIPQILDLLANEKVITQEQQQTILKQLDKAQAEGRKAFAGDLGIELGFYDKSTLDKYLLEQTVRKAVAAITDIQKMISGQSLTPPTWLQANWGNNGVNPASLQPTQADGVSAAANIAQNIVMIANTRPDLAVELQGAVVAAANLARGIAYGSSERVPLDKKWQEWMNEAQTGLQLAIEKANYTPKDRNGAPINLADFITERFKEINAGIKLSLDKQQGKQVAVSLNS